MDMPLIELAIDDLVLAARDSERAICHPSRLPGLSIDGTYEALRTARVTLRALIDPTQPVLTPEQARGCATKVAE